MKNNTIFIKIAMLVVMFFTIKALNAIDCEECCKAGRTVSTECCRQCNGCQMYDDQTTQECRDVPS